VGTSSSWKGEEGIYRNESPMGLPAIVKGFGIEQDTQIVERKKGKSIARDRSGKGDVLLSPTRTTSSD